MPKRNWKRLIQYYFNKTINLNTHTQHDTERFRRHFMAQMADGKSENIRSRTNSADRFG